MFTWQITKLKYVGSLKHQHGFFGHIISHGVFQILDHQTPSPGQPSWGDHQSKWRNAPWFPVLIHSHLNAFSAASIMFLVSLLSCNPLMPKRLNA